MTELEIIRDLIKRFKETDSISEKNKLEKLIHTWAFNILQEIGRLESELEIEPDFRLSGKDWNPCKKPNYGIYLVTYSEDNKEICIWHQFTRMNESDEAFIYIPFYVLEDLESGLLEYNRRAVESYRRALCNSIFDTLKDVKKKFINLKSIPPEFQEIINNSFWELI